MWPKIALAALFSMLFSLSAMAATTQPCPWLNAATASGALKGPIASISVTYSNQENSDATCEFTAGKEHSARRLRIEVGTMNDLAHDFPKYLAKCGHSGKSVGAIGNQALACSIRGRNNEVLEQVVSRVRERAFVVDVGSDSHTLTQNAMRDIARKVAEQVAGFLF